MRFIDILLVVVALFVGYQIGRVQAVEETRHAIRLAHEAVDGWQACVDRHLNGVLYATRR